MKKLLLGIGAATLVAASSFAQSFTDVAKLGGVYNHRRATVTPSTVITPTGVIDTRGLLAIGVSASQQTTFTIVYMSNDLHTLSSTQVTSSGTEVVVINQAPLWFPFLKISPTSPMAAGTATVDLINSRPW